MSELFPPRYTLPLTREVRFTSQVNRASDYSEVRSQDQAGPLFRWNLQIGPLTDAEAAALQSFYAARNGAYESFIFFDPLDNLLRWSEDFSQAPWVKTSPSALQITYGIGDPQGGTSAQTLTNTGASVNTISQPLAANPLGITFTASVWLMGAGVPVTLRISDGASQVFSKQVTLTGSWQRYSVTGSFTASGAQIVCEVDLPANASAVFFGAQLVATPGPGAYSRTTTVSGYHAKCCFDATPPKHRVIAPGHNQIKFAIVETA